LKLSINEKIYVNEIQIQCGVYIIAIYVDLIMTSAEMVYPGNACFPYIETNCDGMTNVQSKYILVIRLKVVNQWGVVEFETHLVSRATPPAAIGRNLTIRTHAGFQPIIAVCSVCMLDQLDLKLYALIEKLECNINFRFIVKRTIGPIRLIYMRNN